MAHMNVAKGIPVQTRWVSMSCKHPELTLRNFDNRFAFTCNACRELGYGKCFNCINGCDYHLHEECAAASPETCHPFFEQCLFSLKCQGQPNSSDFCMACGMSVKGLMSYYHTHKNGSITYLHPCCMKLPHCINTNDNESLTLKEKLESRPCHLCNRTSLGHNVNGWGYVSGNQEVACHVKCMKDMLHQNWLSNIHQKNMQGFWWLNAYGGYESPSSPVGSSHRHLQYPYHAGGHQQQSNTMATRIFWKLTEVAFGLFFNVAVGDMLDGAIQDMF